MGMNPDRQERLLDSLIAFIGERTGLSRDQITSVFDADLEFWQHHKQDFLAELYSDEE